LLLNAVLSTTTLPLAPLFRDPSDRSRALGVDAGEQAALLTRTEAGGGEKPPARTKGERLDTRGVLELNAILWLTDWRVALLLLGSTYILGMGFTFLTLIDEVLPLDIRDIKTVLAVVFLFSGMAGMVAIGSFVDATKEFVGTLRAVLIILVSSCAHTPLALLSAAFHSRLQTWSWQSHGSIPSRLFCSLLRRLWQRVPLRSCLWHSKLPWSSHITAALSWRVPSTPG